MIKVLFFGPVADRVKQREMQLEHAAGMRLQDIVTDLSARYPDAFKLVCFIAVNQSQVSDLALLVNDGDEIAFMAKFSGG